MKRLLYVFFSFLVLVSVWGDSSADIFDKYRNWTYVGDTEFGEKYYIDSDSITYWDTTEQPAIKFLLKFTKENNNTLTFEIVSYKNQYFKIGTVKEFDFRTGEVINKFVSNEVIAVNQNPMLSPVLSKIYDNLWSQREANEKKAKEKAKKEREQRERELKQEKDLKDIGILVGGLVVFGAIVYIFSNRNKEEL